MLKSLLPTAVNDNALSVPFMIDKEVMAEIFGCNDIYDSGTLHGWTNIMLFQHYFKVTVERKAETIGINSKRPSCHNLYCVFLLIPYFPVYKFQNRQHCLTASVCQWSKAEEKKEWLILTHSSRVFFFTGKQSKINLIFAFKEFSIYFFLPSIWIFMVFFSKNCWW